VSDGPPGPDGDHLDPLTLAELREGLLESAAARAAEDHLAHCDTCAADDRALAALPSLLGAVGDVGPIPADVARRLDEAIAAEPRIPVEAAATVTPLAPRTAAPQQVRGMRLLQAAAVLVVILLGVGIALGPWDGGGGSSSDSGAAQKSAGSAGDGAGEAEAGAGSFPVTNSGRAWTEDSITTSLPALLDGTLGPAAASAPGAISESDAPGDDASESPPGSGQPDLSRQNGNGSANRLSGGPALTDCVTQLNEGPTTPLSVDLGTWSGKPAAVIVLPTKGDEKTVDVFVVAEGCPPGDLLYFTRAARP
jgi:hypothetical protein